LTVDNDIVDTGVVDVTGVTQEMINELRAADEHKMLRDLQRLLRKGRDLEFRGQHGETPVSAHHYVSISYCYYPVIFIL